MKDISKSRSEELDYRGLYNQLLQKHNLLKAQFEEVKAQNEEMKAQLKQNTATIADLMQKNHQREVAKISAAGAAPQNPVPALVSHKSSPIMKPAKPKIHSQLSTSSEALVQEMMQEMMGEISHNEDTTRRTLPVLKETGGNARTKLPALGIFIVHSAESISHKLYVQPACTCVQRMQVRALHTTKPITTQRPAQGRKGGSCCKPSQLASQGTSLTIPCCSYFVVSFCDLYMV